MDSTWLEGYRIVDRQEKLYKQKKTKVKRGLHNVFPSEAADVAPYPLQWPKKPGFVTRWYLKPVKKFVKEYGRFYYHAGVVKGIASEMKRHGEIDCDIRQGCDWDGDGDFLDQTFDDLVHHEVKED